MCPAAANEKIITVAEFEPKLLMLSSETSQLCHCMLADGVNYIEDMLLEFKQLVSAIGKELTPMDFQLLHALSRSQAVPCRIPTATVLFRDSSARSHAGGSAVDRSAAARRLTAVGSDPDHCGPQLLIIISINGLPLETVYLTPRDYKPFAPL